MSDESWHSLWLVFLWMFFVFFWWVHYFQILAFALLPIPKCNGVKSTPRRLTLVEPHQCPSHQLINPRTNSWNFHEKISNWRFWKSQFFWVSHFDFFFCFIPIKISHKLCVRCMIMLVYSQKWPTPSNNTRSVHCKPGPCNESRYSLCPHSLGENLLSLQGSYPHCMEPVSKTGGSLHAPPVLPCTRLQCIWMHHNTA